MLKVFHHSPSPVVHISSTSYLLHPFVVPVSGITYGHLYKLAYGLNSMPTLSPFSTMSPDAFEVSESDINWSGLAEGERDLEYLPDYQDLPICRPVGFPHIVKLESVDEFASPIKLRLPDGVVTVLFHYDPQFLARSLDLSQHKVFFHRHENSDSVERDFVIERVGSEVMVSRPLRFVLLTSELILLLQSVVNSQRTEP